MFIMVHSQEPSKCVNVKQDGGDKPAPDSESSKTPYVKLIYCKHKWSRLLVAQKYSFFLT